MEKRVKIALAVLGFSVLGVFGWRTLWTPEPVYQHQSLGKWLSQYDRLVAHPIQSSADRQLRDDSEKAIYTIGTNAIPFLLMRLGAHDSRFVSQIRLLVSRLSFLKIHQPTPQALRSQGASGFLALGPKGRVAIPKLAKLLEDRSDPSIGQLVVSVLTKFNDESVIPVLVRATTSHNSEVRKTAMVELGYRRSSAEGVIQSLVDGLADQDEYVRTAAVFASGKFPNQADLVVPALVLHLQDPSSTVRDMAASSLGALGEQAKAAVPALVEIVKRQGPHGSAASALRLVDPTAAAKAGLAPMITPPSFE
jgi:hypothetical protein